MSTFSIAVIPGDGIGKEVIPEAIRVLDLAAEIHDLELEWQHKEKCMPVLW